MSLTPHRTALALLAAALVALAPGLSRADEPRPNSRAPRPASPSDERVSGVILKVEKAPSAEGARTKKERRHALRLTVNTAAVWRDWARDQIADRPDESPRAAAAEGANSIATKGEPQEKDSLVTIHVGRGAKVETRFRAPDDETSKGSRTPEKSSARPTVFRAEDLKPGLFVEVDYARKGERNVASTVTVIRPSGVPAAGVKAKK